MSGSLKAFKPEKACYGANTTTIYFQGTERFFKPSYIGNLISSWLPAVEGAVEKLQTGAKVADIGTGHGISTLIMAEAFPNSPFIGFDNHQPSIERANQIAREKGVQDRVEFKLASAQEFPGEQYNLITYFDCLHDMGDPVGSLQQAYNSLAPDGVVMVIEPMAGRKTEENFNPVGRVYSGASVLCCTPNAIASGPYAWERLPAMTPWPRLPPKLASAASQE